MRAAPVLVLHGGTGPTPSHQRLQQIRRHLIRICDAAYSTLDNSSAVKTVVLAVQLLENDPLFNAGTGAMLQQDGKARLTASIMDGAKRRFAAVLNLERAKNPILVAQALLDQPDRLLAGHGATAFARSLGFPSWNPVTPSRWRQWQRHRQESHSTVGAVALDRSGRLAAATSTGGKGFERPGRVSDSGLPAGNYATEEVAIACTGIGEDIIDEGLAIRIAQRVLDGNSLKRASALTIRELTRANRKAGLIGLDKYGHIVWITNLPMLFAVAKTPRRQLISP